MYNHKTCEISRKIQKRSRLIASSHARTHARDRDGRRFACDARWLDGAEDRTGADSLEAADLEAAAAAPRVGFCGRCGRCGLCERRSAAWAGACAILALWPGARELALRVGASSARKPAPL